MRCVRSAMKFNSLQAFDQREMQGSCDSPCIDLIKLAPVDPISDVSSYNELSSFQFQLSLSRSSQIRRIKPRQVR